ncbi:MAG: hypothetical protein L0220_21505, partial [Acidobacteria bacterium]|nr:hypothetical protein [Acidobacteriota bacterium]
VNDSSETVGQDAILSHEFSSFLGEFSELVNDSSENVPSVDREIGKEEDFPSIISDMTFVIAELLLNLLQALCGLISGNDKCHI